MIELEKLYDIAGDHLDSAQQDWAGFAQDFHAIFEGQFVLYRSTYKNGVLACRSLEDVIATTDSKKISHYVGNSLFEFNEIPDASLQPLEPQRRSDIMSDEKFMSVEVVKKFFLPNGIFHLMAVAAILPDKTRLMFVIWRNKKQKNFSDIEKQRMALFMRYLAVLVSPQGDIKPLIASIEIDEFSRKYKLTKAEAGVLFGLLTGKSLRELALDSGRSYGTLRWHVRNMLSKCSVSTQQTLLAEFYRLIKR